MSKVFKVVVETLASLLGLVGVILFAAGLLTCWLAMGIFAKVED